VHFNMCFQFVYLFRKLFNMIELVVRSSLNNFDTIVDLIFLEVQIV